MSACEQFDRLLSNLLALGPLRLAPFAADRVNAAQSAL
jgi:hypothetical protein